jgi:hypothetical protein
MSKKIMICAVLVFFALSMNVALSDMVYPPELMEVSAPYPGATIAQTTNASGTVMVMMQSNDNLDSIFEFYKNELSANGWTITAETKSQGHSGLMGEKGSNNVVVNIGTGQSGKSIIALMLAPKQ